MSKGRAMTDADNTQKELDAYISRLRAAAAARNSETCDVAGCLVHGTGTTLDCGLACPECYAHDKGCTPDECKHLDG